MKWTVISLAFLALLGPRVAADTVVLKDGRTLQNCYVRDEGTRYTIWETLADVGKPPAVYPRSAVASVKIERGDDWDVQPKLPDLTVTYIEMTPKLAGLHGRVHYDSLGRPSLRGGTALIDFGDRTLTDPEGAAKNLKLKYTDGEPITLTAHVKNIGFVTARPFEYVWQIDGADVQKGRFTRGIREMDETTFTYKWKWVSGQHTATFKIVTTQPEIAVINNTATDPLWALTYTYIVTPGRIKAWHKYRSAYGTFSFEDFYRWHLDIMNQLFAASIYPAAPEGIKARVRLDRIIYTEDVAKAGQDMVAADGIRYDQGGWSWINDEDTKKVWEPPTKEWRNQTEWSLPHELGHQLGLVDYYALDYAGTKDHVMPDNGDMITHFQNHPVAMMHWHGPSVFNEVDAGYMNMTWDKPRGYFGDYYFAIPTENYLRIVDVNGQPVADAKVEVYQRGVVMDSKAPGGEDAGVSYAAVIEDGNFDHPLSKDPVIWGSTDPNGILRLPNRPAAPVKTLLGFERKPNPFGNINVVGNRGLMLVKVTKFDRPCWYFLEAFDFNVAWFRGQKDKFTTVLKTPYRSVDSPLPPNDVRVEALDGDKVKVTWAAPTPLRETQYLDKPIAYRIYRRISSDGLNGRPWYPVATVVSNLFEAAVDLKASYVEDVYWYTRTNRFAVSTIGELGLESELVEVLLKQP